MSRNIQISEDLFTDLLIYFGIQTEAEPTEYRRQQIHDALALKVQAMNNRVRYKQHLGYEGQTPAQNADVLHLTRKCPPCMTDPEGFRSFLISIGHNEYGAGQVIDHLMSGYYDTDELNLFNRYNS